MRIAFDAKRYIANPTGLGNYSRWLVNGLKSKFSGHDYLLCAAQNADSSNSYLGPKNALYKAFPSIWRVKWITKDLSKNKVDIYHGLSNELPFGIHHSGIKTVVTIHDLIQKRYPENYSMIDRSIYNAKVNYAQKRADVIVVPSLQTKRDLLNYFHTEEQKIHCIPLGFDTKIRKSKVQENEEYILCVSGFNRRKNLVRLVKAFKSSKLSCKLIIAGKSGDSLLRLKKLSENTPSIELIVDPSSEALQSLYGSALFCVYPSLFEGFGMPIIEAMQFGKVVAASNNSSLPEVGGEAAYYFEAEDVKSIQSALENLYHSPSLRLHHEALIQEQLNQFDEQIILQKYWDLYLSLS